MINLEFLGNLLDNIDYNPETGEMFLSQLIYKTVSRLPKTIKQDY